MADVIAHLSVQADEWFEMNEDQRKAYVNEFNKMPVDDAMKGKAITINHVPTGELSECKEFSLDATKILKSLHYWKDGLVATIVKDAETLLNAKDAVQQCRPWELMRKGSFWWLQKIVKQACTNVQSSMIT